jgi:hypothetical protein
MTAFMVFLCFRANDVSDQQYCCCGAAVAYGTERTRLAWQTMSAFWGISEAPFQGRQDRF